MTRNPESSDLHSRPTGESTPDDAEQTADGRVGDFDTGVTAERLLDELQSGREENAGMSVRLTPEQESEVILDRVLKTLFDDPGFEFEEQTVKENLEEILLVLIAHRSSNTHGKSLMGDLTAIFGTRLSPGTVYPQLHELEAAGALRVQELVRTKEYQVEDEQVLRDRVTATMEQHLAFGLFLQAALEELP
ncbi:helix-turn-helix transcriptional regulator [Halolamina litorea]|uniref:Helix-turn-helix transcriptional regulator n=1 Tax=Halolamina litorea TaxID=1515593 RepID=A0ABD6BV56_9EURY|nr:helix-turn-helix transcriptional regulator [Halolamina litorea]